ncbi:hypothetical protein B0O99DRAFT_656987 [Bisporella sp. PMI_857]|nr:hypothetical protein B0O99DRAFT_656987 [Bisporella sp. PMI_857]
MKAAGQRPAPQQKKRVEPESRSLKFVYYSSQLKWHVKVTFKGTFQSAQTSNFARKPERRKHLMNFCLCIDFNSINLLNDTVTELIITHQQDARTTNPQCQMLWFKTTLDTETEYLFIANRLCVSIQEDSLRVRFPIYTSAVSSVLTTKVSEITKTQELSIGVYTARIVGSETTYVYKEVDRPLYKPKDSEVLEKELRNLTLLRSIESVVQLVAVAVSRNPYQTTKTNKNDDQTVFREILFEYYSNGTLQNVLQSAEKDLPWHQWAVQITCALNLKPANILLSENLTATLADFSGIGGTSRDWLSPEMRTLSEPLFQDMNSPDAACNETEQRILKRVSRHATTEVRLRVSFQNALSMLLIL